ncbi:MAG: antibiotic biosynthesis monooxygenase [Bacteroidota bacterium]|nr:antibiotic biosynthesis monooxygenase [Bacteroidota bacterium]
MVVRLTRFKIPPDRIKDAKKIYKKEIVPEVRVQKGNLNVMLLEPTDDSHDYISFTAWESEEDATNYETSGKFKELAEKINGLLSGKIKLKTYHAKLRQ